MVDGVQITGGTTIGVNAWVMNRNEDIFGADVEEFRSERWIESPPEKIKDMHRNLFTVSKETPLPQDVAEKVISHQPST